MIIDRNKLSKAMLKYVETKDKNPDALLFYQLGDFYEMFFDDAIITSKVLDLTLTGKDCGLSERAPMCGIPIHAIDNYLPKLVQAGYKVVLCNQVSEPNPKSKELVERDIVKIVTAGTLTDNLDDKRNNYIMSIAKQKEKIALAYADITTGKLNLLNVESPKDLEDAIARVCPAEIICNREAKEVEEFIVGIKLNIVPKFAIFETASYGFEKAEKVLKNHFNVNSLTVFDIAENNRIGVMATGGLIEYLTETQKRSLANINRVEVERPKIYMHLDSNTRKNLELTENMTTRKKKGSLIGLIDKTKTSMGARKLRAFIEQPSVISSTINSRLDGIEEYLNNKMLTDNLIEVLSSIYDIERITGKIAYGSVMPKDCVTLRESLKRAKKLKRLLTGSVKSPINLKCIENLGEFDELIDLLDRAIIDEPPVNLKDGGYIKQGYHDELDTYKMANTMGKQWLAELEIKIKEETGIKNLKISFNRVFGYYIEVTNSQLSLVPANWIRRQTTVGGERFINEELKVLEDKILASSHTSIKLESELYAEIKNILKSYIRGLQDVSDAIAIIDTLISLAVVALENNWVRPAINDSVKEISIKEGKHPVVESLLASGSFVSNDCLLDTNENRTMIITGPNMAGKSTFMRQVAIITFLAHIGSFVPAKEARIAITDRIFTRIGASDDLAFGQSTFMVEMTEVANILHNATSKSLLVLDEIGRGTSTYDGLSIAWAVVEYLSKHLNAKTLFATHYHELTDLEGKIDGVKNYKVLIKEINDSIIFLHKIARGSANKSFGIEVASIAGLPAEIISRAKELLYIQESANSKATEISFDAVKGQQKNNINTDEIINILKEIDINNVSPLVAFSILQDVVEKIKK